MEQVLSKIHQVLADTMGTYYTTHAFHWNVLGADFAQLHDKFAEQYTEMWEALDVIAESMRTLGGFPANDMAELCHMTEIHVPSKIYSSEDMIKILAGAHEIVIASLTEAFDAAEQNNLQDIMDLMVERIRTHRKYHWQLTAMSS